MQILEKVKTIRSQTWIVAAVLFLGLLAVGATNGATRGQWGTLAGMVALATAAIGILQLETFYRLQSQNAAHQAEQATQLAALSAQQNNLYAQTEALFSLFNLIQLNCPLPAMRDWAVSPDLAKAIATLIIEHQPQLVLEVGSGVSTLISGYCLQRFENAQVIALDHEASFAAISMQRVLSHQLQSVAKVVHAPLKAVTLHDTTWQWYDLDSLFPLPRSIDLLVVDGPPRHLQKDSRYPALPLLFEHLSDRAIIVLDDADRPDEQAIVERWKQEFQFSEITQIPTEKGALMLRIQK